MPTIELKQVEKTKEIILNSHDEVDQILGRPPSWLLRWGISLVFIAVIIFGLLAWLIKYPDVILAPIIITTENPAIAVVSRSSGKLTHLYLTNNQKVKQGQVIGLLESTTSLEDVEALELFLEKVDVIQSRRQYLKIKPLKNLVLGNLQSTYASLIQKINDYQFFLKRKGISKKTTSYENQIAHTKRLNQNLVKQKKTLQKEINIFKKDLLRNRKLNKQGVIPDTELEKIESQFLQYQRQLDGMESQIVNNEMSIEQYHSQIIDLSQNRLDGHSTRKLSIEENVERLKSEIEAWKKAYLIIAPISGKASFSKIWSEQQFVNANEEVLTIVPTEGVGKIIGKALLPIANSGKVKSGQVVNIELNGFPSQEFGLIKSTVHSIALVPKEENYLLEIELPDSLITTYNKTISFRQEMSGIANIITEDRRVLERIFDKVNNILKN